MSTDPDELRAQIDATRARMSHDVNELTDYAAPANVASRQVGKVRSAVGGAATNVKDKVMGQASAASHSASSAGGSISDAASSASDAVSSAPAAVTERTRGNPLAAGLVALGAGWLLGSLLPASAKEEQAATAVKDNASTLAQPLADAAKDAASSLREPAADAVQSVKESAQQGAATVRDEGASAAQDVSSSASSATDEVRRTR